MPLPLQQHPAGKSRASGAERMGSELGRESCPGHFLGESAVGCQAYSGLRSVISQKEAKDNI